MSLRDVHVKGRWSPTSAMASNEPQLPSSALAGIKVIVTRPREQAPGLASAIAARGGVALIHPALEILPILPNPALSAALARLAEFDFVGFVSANAVNFGLPAGLQWPDALCCLAPGPGTAAALQARGARRILLPHDSFDSEGLLALPELQHLVGKRALILRGEGGRELLAEALRARGAVVEQVACYRRQPAVGEIARLGDLLRQHEAQAMVVTSGEALAHLLALLDPAALAVLRSMPVFVPHPRIAERARDAHCQQVILTAGADAGVLEGLVQHFRRV